MASVSWKNNISGTWATAANWSTGLVPGPNDDVTIATATPQTITYAANTDSILSLYMTSGTLAMTGGALSILGNATIAAAVTESGATTLQFAGANASISGNVTQTSGTINDALGWLHLSGTANSFSGTLSGAAVEFAYGADTLAAGMVLNVAQILVSSANVTLGQNFVQTGIWSQTGGSVALGGHTLTVSGVANLDGGVVNGAGTLGVQRQGRDHRPVARRQRRAEQQRLADGERHLVSGL